jgi:hypothetical protein
MIKKQQKWIALLVTLTFVWLLQVSTMPLAAANTAEQISSANKEQGPRFIEEESNSSSQVTKKHSILPILLICVGVTAGLAAVYFLVIKKTNYTLTVTVGTGCTGTPASSAQSYKKGTTVAYNYSKLTGYGQLTVMLDGAAVASSGTITMNGNHTLAVTALKIGVITSVTVKYDVIFAGSNLKAAHNVKVNGVDKINETFYFNSHYSSTFEGQMKIARTFTATQSLGTMLIRQEVNKNYSGYYGSESVGIGSTGYTLSVFSYTYDNGADPGAPTLSESTFYLNVAPWGQPTTGDWPRIREKTITVNAPSQQAAPQNNSSSKAAGISTSKIE